MTRRSNHVERLSMLFLFGKTSTYELLTHYSPKGISGGHVGLEMEQHGHHSGAMSLDYGPMPNMTGYFPPSSPQPHIKTEEDDSVHHPLTPITPYTYPRAHYHPTSPSFQQAPLYDPTRAPHPSPPSYNPRTDTMPIQYNHGGHLPPHHGLYTNGHVQPGEDRDVDRQNELDRYKTIAEEAVQLLARANETIKTSSEVATPGARLIDMEVCKYLPLSSIRHKHTGHRRSTSVLLVCLCSTAFRLNLNTTRLTLFPHPKTFYYSDIARPIYSKLLQN